MGLEWHEGAQESKWTQVLLFMCWLFYVCCSESSVVTVSVFTVCPLSVSDCCVIILWDIQEDSEKVGGIVSGAFDGEHRKRVNETDLAVA